VSTGPFRIRCATCDPSLLPPDFDPVALIRAADEAKAKRAEEMPDEHTAIGVMFGAWLRLKELGWRDATYAPTDHSPLQLIEAGSTGIHEGYRDAERRFWITDDDTWPSRPVLWRPAERPEGTP
jgi:hypothetical protein